MQEDSGNVTASGRVVGESGVGDAVDADDADDTPAASPPSPESPTNGTTGDDGGITQAAASTSSTSPTNGATDGAEGPTPSAPAFYKEGDTIKCPNAAVGDEGEVDGVTYTKRDRGGLAGLVQDIPRWSQLSRSCTTGVVDMSSL